MSVPEEHCHNAQFFVLFWKVTIRLGIVILSTSNFMRMSPHFAKYAHFRALKIQAFPAGSMATDPPRRFTLFQAVVYLGNIDVYHCLNYVMN